MSFAVFLALCAWAGCTLERRTRPTYCRCRKWRAAVRAGRFTPRSPDGGHHVYYMLPHGTPLDRCPYCSGKVTTFVVDIPEGELQHVRASGVWAFEKRPRGKL